MFIAEGTNDGAASAENRPGTYEERGPQGPGRCLRCIRPSAEGTRAPPPTPHRPSPTNTPREHRRNRRGRAQRGAPCLCGKRPTRLFFSLSLSVSNPLFLLILSTFDPMRVSPRAQTTVWRLLQTYLARVYGGPKGPVRYVRCLGPSLEGTGCRSLIRNGVICPYFVNF